jgi:hypothetical protein
MCPRSDSRSSFSSSRSWRFSHLELRRRTRRPHLHHLPQLDSPKWTNTFASEDEMIAVVNGILGRQRTRCDVRQVIEKIRTGERFFFDLDMTRREAEALDDLRQTVEKLKETNESLTRSEAYLAEAQKLSHTGSFGWDVSTGEQFWSEETYQIFEYDRMQKPTFELALARVHPEDLHFVRQVTDGVSQHGGMWI